MKEPLLHPIVGANDLEDVPSKVLVELPRNEAQDDGDEANDGGDGNEVRLDIGPNHINGQSRLEGVVFLKEVEGLGNLVDLNPSVYHKGKVGEADSNDLDCVLLSESIPDNDELVQETEDEECQESGDSLVLRFKVFQVPSFGAEKARLKPGKNVSGGDVNTKEARMIIEIEFAYASKHRHITAWMAVTAINIAAHLLLMKPKKLSRGLDAGSDGATPSR